MSERCESSKKVGSKNRASRAGTRSVASLTPEQLAKKRANDREAQRSIRLRTKTHIADLERRIRELSGERDDRVFEAVWKRNMELEEELRHISEALRRSQSEEISSDSMGVQAQNSLGSWDNQQQQMAYLPLWSSRTSHEGTEISASFYSNENSEDLFGYPNSNVENLGLNHQNMANQHECGNESMIGHSPSVPVPIPNRSLAPFTARSNSGKNRLHPQSASTSPPITCSSSSASGPQHDPNSNLSFTSHPTNRVVSFNHSNNNGIGNNGSRNAPGSSINNILGGEQTPTQPDISTSTYGVSNSLPFVPRIQSTLCSWETTLPFHNPANAIESMLFACIKQKRSLTALESKADKNPWRPSIKELMNPELNDDIQGFDALLANVIKSMVLRDFPVKVGFFCILHYFLSWQAAPSKVTWDNMPLWMRPEPIQLSNRHPILASLIFWPHLRKAAIESQSRYFPVTSNQSQDLIQSPPPTSFIRAFTSSLTFSWPYSDSDIFFLSDTNTEDVHVSDTFLTYAHDLANWTLDSNFDESWS